MNVMIAEDEEPIRLGLAALVERLNPDFRVVGTYANGRELLQELDRKQADLILTDVKMPVMDGLELAQIIHARGFPERCVIISGFNDFEMAREAMRYGVEDYLLKPIDKQELANTLAKVAQSVREERQRHAIAREDALRAILMHEAADVKTAAIGSLELASWTGCFVMLAALSCSSDVPAASAEGETAISRIVSCTAWDGCRAYLLCISEKAGEDAETEARNYAADLLAASGACTIGISKPVKDCRQLREAFMEAQAAAAYGMYDEAPATIIGADALPDAETDWSSLYKLTDTLLEKDAPVDYERLSFIIRRLFLEFGKLRPPYAVIVRLITRLSYAAITATGVLSKLEEPDWWKLPDDWAGIKLSELEKRVQHHFAAWYRTEKLPREHRIVDFVKQLIQEQYDREFDLAHIAERVYLNPTYLSKLFKNETGETIRDYLIRVRIERAKLLLRTKGELKTYEVGERVGYPDAAYFNKLFKKIVGVTPKEYKDFGSGCGNKQTEDN